MWLGVLSLSGCVITPEFSPTNEQKSLIPDQWLAPNTITEQRSEDLSVWWEQWNDPRLSELIKASQQYNTDIRIAQGNLRVAQATLAIAEAGLFPSLSGSSDGQRTHRYGSGSNSFGIGLNGTWTIDAGGRYAAMKAATFDLLSTEATLADVQTEIASQVANAYINLKLFQKQLEVARQNLETQKESLQIADWRYKAGLVDSTDVDQARTSYEQTRSIIPEYLSSIQENRNLLATLTNKKPEDIIVDDFVSMPVAPQNLALSIPGETLRKRPSVRQAEATVKSAMAKHTQARSALYPSLSIGGNFGLSATTVGSLGEVGTHTSSIFGSLNLPIFNAGELRAQVEAKDAQVAIANAQYEASLLSAVKDVEDALNSIWSTPAKFKSLALAVNSARSAALSAQQNYKAGLQDFTVVLATQKTLLSVEESYASVQAQIAKSYVALYRALGGGWVPSEGFEK